MFILPAAATSCATSLAASCACWSAGALGRSIASRSARLAFVGFFSFSLALAWVLRLGAEPLVKHLPCEEIVAGQRQRETKKRARRTRERENGYQSRCCRETTTNLV